ncbi:MAG TPA: sugar ABC transporter substrate-binding protein [Rectinemataceae bacterium]|nr:sugar ABC transporter substrate-binding protein [Rectinemataceae bacterium]
MKLRSSLIGLALALTLLASCAGGDRGKTITVLNWGSEAEAKVWSELAADFGAKTGIKVNIETAEWDVYWEKINTLYAANTPPEVFAMDAPLFLDWYSRDALLPLDPYIKKDQGLVNGLFPEALAAYKTDKGYFGLPRDFQTIVLFYNKAMFDQAKLPYPKDSWTWDDLRAAAKKLTLRDSAGKITQWGFSPDLWDIEPFMSSLVWSYGGDIISADHKKTLIGDKLEPWQLVWDMIHVDKSIPDQDTQTQYGNDMFRAGKAAMISIGHWSVPEYTDAGIDWAVAPMPKGPAGRATSVNSAGFVMAKNCKNPEAGWKWISFVLSEEGQTKLASLNFAVPARKSVAQSQAFLENPAKVDNKLFIDALAYAHLKPIFVGYDAWSTAFGDNLAAIYDPTKTAAGVVKAAVDAADRALAGSK